jgi:hypothetical protein
MTRITRESLAAAPEVSTSPTLLELLPRFRRHLAAANKAPRTIESYAEAVEQLHRFLTASGMPVRAASITGEHLEAFLVDQLERLRPSSARIRYASLQQFWRWVATDGEIASSLMNGVPRPQVPEQPVPVLSEDELKALVRIAEADGDSCPAETLPSSGCSPTPVLASRRSQSSTFVTLTWTAGRSGCSAREGASGTCPSVRAPSALSTGTSPSGDAITTTISRDCGSGLRGRSRRTASRSS